MLVVQAGQFFGDDLGTPLVDQPGGQRGAGQRQPVQAEGQFHEPPTAAAGQGQRNRDLVIDVIERPPVPALPSRGFAAGGQPGHCRHPERGGPGGQPVGGLQYSGQLIIIEGGQVLLPDLVG